MEKGARKILSFWELTKPTITGLVLVTTSVGFYLATAIDGKSLLENWVLLLNTLLGSAAVAGGVGALNEYLERHYDSLMHRTRSRPIPSGRLTSTEGLIFGVGISVFGVIHLAATVNLFTSFLSLFTLLLYLFVYTPLKRRTSLNTIVGAISGALPPIGGWVAVQGNISPDVWLLFGILFFWQIPHFFSIAWIYRKDYARVGFKMIPIADSTGTATGLYIISFCVALVLCSAALSLVGMTGEIYLIGSILLGVAFLVFGIDTAFHRTNQRAKRLMMASVLYLPALLILIVLDKGLFHSI